MAESASSTSKKTSPSGSRVGIVSLGCSKNTVDTENMLGLLAEEGYTIVDDETQADVLLLNTCSFIEASQKESIQTILELGALDKKLIVTGCLIQRTQHQHELDELMGELPEVSAAIGTSEFHQIVDVVKRVEAGERFTSVLPKAKAPVETLLPRLATTLGPSAYLKVSEGCDHGCSFCIIPALRGRYASRPMELIIEEARQLVRGGVRELVLIAEDTTRYGHETSGQYLLPKLLDALCEIEDLLWVRVLYAYPNYMTNELLDTIARQPKVVPYLDMPLQHTHPDMLRAMRRPRHEPVDQLITRMREKVPGIVIRTTFITGFPGETQEHHQHMLDFLKTHRIERVGAFAYSPQIGTAGYAMPDPVPDEVKEARRQAVMEAQQGISLALHQGLVGQVIPMLVEGVETESGRLIGRTHRDAPEIDGTTYAICDRHVHAGDLVPVRITHVDPYDLHGEVVGDPIA
jgi:ribosomal protein S12 methylthiotransferase